MGENLSVKNLVGRAERDPWKAILGSRPNTYQIPEVGTQLIAEVDKALYERKLDDAFTVGIILKKWSERDPHFYCKAPAVMASVYSVSGLTYEAEKKIFAAKKRVNPDCKDCGAQFFKRLGTFYIYQHGPQEAFKAYNKSANLFLAIAEPKEAGVSVMNRGVAKYMMHAYDEAMHDQQYALELLGDEFSMYTIMASANIASIFVAQKNVSAAIERIEGVQEMLVGENDLERPKLILRWMRALLFEAQGDMKEAGEITDRIEVRMRKLDMKPELKVLLADRARMARQEGTVQRIARKALDMEEVPRIRTLIEKALKTPTRDNILKWRNSLDAYIPPFPATA